MKNEQQELLDQVSKLTVQTNVLSLVLAHLIAREAKSSTDHEGWLRQFADEVHATIDRAPDPPPLVQELIEYSRMRLDLLMNAARLYLK